MAVNDNDIELLNEYIDGELPVSECEGLWRRLAIERDLQSELDRFRADHAVRSMMWSTLEPDESSIVRLEAKVMRASRREDMMSWAGNGLRIMASAAALILFGFTVGWLGRERSTGVPIPTTPSNNSSNVLPASTLTGPDSASSQIEVIVRDRATGKVVATPRFDSLKEAQQFMDDLQNPPTPAGTGDNNVSPAVNKF